MKRRLVSLLVAACMIFALLPVSAITAFAEESVLTGYCGADSSYGSQTYDYSMEYKGETYTFTGTYYSNAIWTLTPNGENTYRLTISGTGAMGDFGANWSFGKPWNYALAEKESTAVTESRNKITEIEIAAGITAIGAHAFEGYEKITRVVLPQSVTKIGENSFNSCKGMQSIELSNNLEEIGSTALSDTALTSIELPESLKKIQKSAFLHCTSLAGDLKIPSNVTVIGNDAFANDTALTGTLTIGNSVQTIGDSAFSGCKFTGKLTIPDSVISIGDGAFIGNNFSEISLGRNLEKIGENALNTSGTYTGQLNIPDSVKEIGKSAFNGMGFTSIRLGKSVSSIADTAFQNCTNVHSLDISSIGSPDYGTDVFKSLRNPNTIYVNSEEQKNTITSQISENRSAFAITNGGVFAENTTFEDGKLAIPEKAGHTFAGWYDNAELTGEAVTTPETGKTYYAKWTKNKYTVTFNNNGHGEDPAAMPPVEYGNSVADLPELSDSANEWVFDGWYMDENFTTKYNNQAITGNTTLYAKWHEYQNTSLTAKVSKSNYLVNTPADVNVTVTPGDDISKLMQDKDNIKILLTYDDVTSVMLNGNVLDKKEYSISELMQLMGQNREFKLDVTYDKAGTHTFSVALVDKDGKNVCEAGTDITVVQALMDTTVTEDGEHKETYQANKPITVEMNVTADKETFKQNTLYLTYGDEVEKVELNGHKLTEKQYKISDLLDMMETSPVAAYALRSEADALSIPFEVTFKDAGSYDFEMLVKDAQNQLVCRSIVPIKVEAEKKPDDTKPAVYTLSILGGTVKVNGKETAVDEHGDIAIAKDAKVEVTFDKGILSDAQTFDQWIIKPNSVLNAVDPKSETIIFTMPDEKVTIEAMTKDASIEEDEPNILGTAAVVGTAAAGTAILAWQGYQLGTELYLKTALPAGTAIPTNRAELALLVWNHAGKPAPAAVLPADATDTQKAIAWAVENDLLKAAKDNGETYVDTDSVSRVEVIRVWNKAQEK